MTNTREQYLNILRETPVVPSPMCGISDHAFRSMCRTHGGTFTWTQMVAAEGMVRADKKTIEILDLRGGEPVLGMQLFGCDPDKLAESAARLEELGATVVDLNMGCPARKVTGSNGGSALLRQPDLVKHIFRRMRQTVSVPLTVKMRWDWDLSRGAALDIARIAEGEGLDGVCLHARTREEGYSGEADWDRIKELKDATALPVVGNGDVRTPHDAREMKESTGCDAVMIGRAAIGDPWLLGRSLAAVRGEAIPDLPSWEERRATMIEHARMMFEAKGPHGIVEFRKHAAAYMRGMPGAKRLRERMMKVSTIEALEEALTISLEPIEVE